MSTHPAHAQDPKPGAIQRWRAFWARLTEGFQLEQLWGQFKSEAEAGYVLYVKDVDWEGISREKSKFKRILLSGWACQLNRSMQHLLARWFGGASAGESSVWRYWAKT